jgi:hypothetical protein
VDGWSDLHRKPYQGVTCHHITAAWTLETLSLACTPVSGSQSGVRIRDQVRAVENEFNITGKVVKYVHDTASPEMAAFSTDNKSQPCSAHVYQLVVSSAISEVKPCEKLTNNIGTFVTAIKNSCVLSEKLDGTMAAHKTLLDKTSPDHNYRPLKLIQKVPTRWNTVYTMLERFSSQRAAIEDFVRLYEMENKKNKRLDSLSLALDSDTWDLIGDMIVLLEFFKRYTTVLEGENYPTCSLVLFQWYDLYEELKYDLLFSIASMDTVSNPPQY